METVNLMTLSDVNVDSFDGNKSDSGIEKDIDTWNGEEGDYEF